MTEPSTYPGYRTARMPWLPPVPEHWNEQRAKTFLREVDERSRTGQEELLSVSHLTGVTPRSQKNVTMFKAASYAGSKLCRPGDIVVNTLWAWMAALGASKHAGIVSPAYGVYRPHSVDSFNPAYLDYLLRTRAYVSEYIGRSTGIRSSRLRLYPNQFLDIALLQPPRTEQDQIVAYLRAQDAHIARLIKAKRELITLLTEQKLRIIDHAVTRGLDASVQVKPSGIDWAPNVPVHWSVQRLKSLCLMQSGEGITSFEIESSGSFPVYGGNGLRGFAASFTHDGGYALIGRQGAHCGNVHLVRGKFWASEHAVVATLKSQHDLEWFASVLSAMNLNRHSAAAAQPGLAVERIRNLLIPVPPAEEQKRISVYIASETREFEVASAKIREEINLIREYRDRLIADAVTGQVDVRGWDPGSDHVIDDKGFDLLSYSEDDLEEDVGELT